MQYDLVDIEQTDPIMTEIRSVQGRGQEKRETGQREKTLEDEVSIILIMVMVSKM